MIAVSVGHSGALTKGVVSSAWETGGGILLEELMSSWKVGIQKLGVEDMGIQPTDSCV